MDKHVQQRVQAWLTGSYDAKTKAEVKDLMETNPTELTESFYKNLEFGTGGLRGIMGAGTNRMNKYTVGMATQGLANYLKRCFPELPQIKVAIAYDCRNNSSCFAQITAHVLAANGIKVYLFEALRPTPELSFTVRHLGCQGGVVITASHNPKEYNGYKAYWNDGAQVTSPHDKNIIAEVEKITDPQQVLFEGNDANIQRIGKDIDELYLTKVLSLELSPEAVNARSNLRIVYTPLHGTGVTLIPEALRRKGFTNIIRVPEQDVSDGNFPTVQSPNPEEPTALKMAIDKATTAGADIVMASDPDADRVGLAIRNLEGEFVLLNGNQTNTLLTYYILRRWKELGKLTGKEYIIKTIVTTDLMRRIAEHYGVECYNVYTGFKNIAEVIRDNEGSKTFIAGGEESFGYNVGEFVRDKDAVTTCCTIAEMAAWANEQGKTLFEILLGIYVEFGYFKETLIALTKKGKDGLTQIQDMMKRFRSVPLKTIDGAMVVRIHDYSTLETIDIAGGGARSKINLRETSNVLQYETDDHTIISLRPSGTEPKIKFYFGAAAELKTKDDYLKVAGEMNAKFERIAKELGIATSVTA
ncbi:MAG: phospho-sugar mutase [Prevotellaceae bacterium]|jgi:phosphoglucomutase|nr:phospho-sugar mutase [Prevotellaceae bacterium]